MNTGKNSQVPFTLFVETHSFGKSFSWGFGQQNALSRNFIAIIIKDVHLNPLRSHWFYNTQQTSLQENTIFMWAIYATIEIVKLNDHRTVIYMMSAYICDGWFILQRQVALNGPLSVNVFNHVISSLFLQYYTWRTSKQFAVKC